ncbi:MAG: magnesium/cobalt transporter CorA [Flavobacteriaceae bacterium]|nr:magnesium/cobalt transporter CorA [Flavobacteriaceae bacterium]
MNKNKRKKHHKKIGQIPGTLIYTGDKTNKLSIECFDYNSNQLEDKQCNKVEDVFHYKATETITWININGLNNTDEIYKLGQAFNIHTLSLEDIVNISQRPKIDEYNDYLLVILKMLYYDNNNVLKSEQISLILSQNFVITLQEAEGDVFDSIRDRIRLAKGKIRNSGSDYLLYALIDAITDHYYYIIEKITDKVENLEDLIFNQKEQKNLSQDIHQLKKEILKIRRTIFPLREIINKIEKSESPYINPKTIHYIRDVYDHSLQISESIELNREMIFGLMDMHMTTISNKMNEVMKVLTIIATIFIPLTFIAGIYGMNFDNIPELHYKYSYFMLLGIMALLFIGMLYYFKRKKWL